MFTHLAADRALVVDLDAKILDLERSLFVLRTEKQLIQGRLDSYKYPVLTLPNEITAEIFIHFLPPYPNYPPFTGLDSPTLLTQICRQWREIALDTPTLWRAMSLSDPSIPFKRKAYLFDTWLSRSRCCPLSIHFDKYDVEDPHAIEILSAVVPHRTRWECLHLSLSPSHMLFMEGPMPLLCRLDLTLDNGSNDGTISFRDAPLLRSITLRAATPLKIAFPPQQITSLTLYRIYRSEYAVILQQTSNLVHCELGVVLNYGTGSSDPPPEHAIELPHLESLALRNYDAPDTTGLLDDFLVTALQSLGIDELFLGPAPIDELASFISKSGCKL
ncbi:hypothetical protein K438DRAFT_441211 [Mycena galopus ATCC 62051]|nr:hypothetical protein K438DRAFT_441211 [Mycena galopus ATCC 62051]